MLDVTRWMNLSFSGFSQLALLTAVALGFVLGEIRVRGWRLGGVAGSLLTALSIAQLGVCLDDGLKAVFLPMFTYALGYGVAPHFAQAFRRSAWRELLLALFVTGSGLLTVRGLTKVFSPDERASSEGASELARAGVSGDVGEALWTWGLPASAEREADWRGDLAPSYAVAYVLVVLGVSFLCMRVARSASRAGCTLPGDDDRADVLYLSSGALAGVALGLLRIELHGLSLTLGNGGGALLSGLTFGWLRARRRAPATPPPAACALLRDLGLAGSLAAIALNTSGVVWQTVRDHGALLLLLATLAALLPLLLSVAFAHYMLGYQRLNLLAESLSGIYRPRWVLVEVVRAEEQAALVEPFAITYAVASVTLALLGSVLMAFP